RRGRGACTGCAPCARASRIGAKHTCGLRLPGLAAGVPADEAEVGDLRCDLFEPLPLDVAVRCELRDSLALPRHRDAHAPRLVGCAGLRAERELAVLDEIDPRPRAAVRDEVGHGLPE